MSGEWIQAKKSNYATQLKQKYSVTRCVLIELSPSCKPPSKLRYESPAQANISGKWGWLPIRLLRFVTFVLLLFSVRSLDLFVASLVPVVFRMGTSCCVLRSILKFWVELSRLIVLWQMFWISRTMAYTTRKPVNRLARKQLHLHPVCQKDQRRVHVKLQKHKLSRSFLEINLRGLRRKPHEGKYAGYPWIRNYAYCTCN